MSRWLARIAVLALLISVAFMVLETKRMAKQVGEAELAAVAARQMAAAAAADLASAQQGIRAAVPQPPTGPQANGPQPISPTLSGVDLQDYTRLQLDLHTTQQQLAVVTRLLEQRNEELERRARAAAEAAANSLKPMPAGVRLCLETLHECLRIEGYSSQRFLRAASLDEQGLHGVEMLESSADGLAVTFVTAALMTAMLDRAKGQLELRFFSGHRAVDGERAALPEEGFLVRFSEVDGHLLEARLPYLVRAEGEYPAPVDEQARPATDVDPGTGRQWLARLDQLLSKAKTTLSWRATRLRGMKDGAFLTVELLGTNDQHLVMGSAHCASLAVEIDEQGGVVSLLLQGGVVRREGRESAITGEGYRMLLPGLTPGEATAVMLRMVVKK